MFKKKFQSNDWKKKNQTQNSNHIFSCCLISEAPQFPLPNLQHQTQLGQLPQWELQNDPWKKKAPFFVLLERVERECLPSSPLGRVWAFGPSWPQAASWTSWIQPLCVREGVSKALRDLYHLCLLSTPTTHPGETKGSSQGALWTAEDGHSLVPAVCPSVTGKQGHLP